MKRLGTSPSLFEPHNLNHVSVFLLTLRLSDLPLGKPLLTYPSPSPSRHHLIARVLAYNYKQIYNIL